MTLPSFISDPNPEIYLSDNYVALDLETTNIEHGSAYEPQNRLLLACWIRGDGHPSARKGGRSRTCWGSEFEQPELLEDIRRADFIVAHFTKFELGWLSRCGLDLRATLPYCTQIGEYVLAGNRKLAGGLGLEASCERYGIPGKHSFVSQLIKAGACSSTIPIRSLESYCAQDVQITEDLFLRQRATLSRELLLRVAYCRNIVTPVLVDIESRGMCLDPARVKEKHGEYSARYAELLTRFSALTGGINHKSGPQMRKYLYETLAFAEATDHRGDALRTKGGKKGIKQPRTDKKVLPLLKATTPEQIEFRDLAIDIAKLKVPVQNLDRMKKKLSKGEQIVYADINQTVVKTHRFSSSGRLGGPQFQNFEREFKPLFCARNKDFVMMEADAPQLEFRVAAFLGNDTTAITEIETGADVHALTAAVYKIPRQQAKEKTFGPLYGATSGSPVDKRYQKAFREKYASIFKTQEGWAYAVARDKQLRIASGLVAYWPDTEIKRGGYVTNSTTIYNYPIQSFATADIIPLTLVLVWHQLAGMESFIVNTIHDSIVLEVPAREVDLVTQCLLDSFIDGSVDMLKKLYNVDFTVPLGVGIKVGAFWSEGEETKHERKISL